jgi:uncharacterized membrane-anchored protein YhcB (DUF1043 family)
MKGSKWLRISLVLLLLIGILFTGCISKDVYQALEEEKSNIETELEELQSDYQTLQTELITTQSDLDAVESEVETLEDALTTSENNLATTLTQKKALESDLVITKERLNEMETAFGKLLFYDDFEDGLFDNTKGWNPMGGNWSVIEEDDNFFLQGLEDKGEHIHCDIIDSYDWTDYTLEFRLNLIQEYFWVNVRANPSLSKRYMIGVSKGGIHIVKHPEGEWITIGYLRTWVRGWNDFKIEVYGDNIKVYVNGVLEINHIDHEPLVSGGINFEAAEYSHIYLDNVLVKTLK